MDSAIRRARRTFTLATVFISLSCAALGAFGTLAITELQLQQKISAAQLGQLAKGNSELSAYIASQAPAHAHFETIASIIQKEDRANLATSLPWLLAAMFAISGLAGWWLSQLLLVPVRESYLAQRRFMQDAAHELRNPLAAMTSMVQQAQNRPPTPAELPALLSAVARQSQQLSTITTELLLLEHRESPGKDTVNLSELLSDVIEELQHLANARALTITSQAPEQLIVPMNAQHFVHIAKNVIENAIKYSQPGGEPIEVKLMGKHNGWKLTVSDHGIGIPESDIPKLSQRFYRGENASQADGTGLGMAIVDKFTRLYSGTLSITSQVGRGTTVALEV